MDKDNANSSFEFDKDPEFNENFYKNIDKVLGDSNNTVPESDKVESIEAEEKSETPDETPRNDVKVDYAGEDSAAANLPLEEEDEEDISDELTDINTSLAKQISAELDNRETLEKEKQKKKKFLFRIQSGVLITLLCLAGIGFFLGFTKPGNQLLMRMGVNVSGKIWASWTKNFEEDADAATDEDYLDDEDLDSKAPEVDPTTIVWPDHPGEGRHEIGVYNILLLGEEAIGSGDARGRTDVIVIATMNTNNKTLKLTSLMRDTFVQIPGFKDNKLNTAYEKGGLDLLYETIALNFDIQLDGCVMVNFEKFEKIIDQLGGLDLTLTADEAKYLRTTNYISNPEYRDVVEGTQHMNGNQVLGYSRIRKRATITGNNNDYGRTDRHRIVLNAIFEKYKSKSKADLAAMMIKFLPMITTDIDDKNFELLLNSFIQMGTTEITQLRIPADGAFDEGKVRGMAVLIPDLEKNRETLHSFIFGDDAAKSNATTTNSNDETGNDISENTGNE